MFYIGLTFVLKVALLLSGHEWLWENHWALIFLYFPEVWLLLAEITPTAVISFLAWAIPVHKVGCPISPTSEPLPLVSTIGPRKSTVLPPHSKSYFSLSSRQQCWVTIPSGIFYLLTLSLRICMMATVNMHFFCGFRKNVVSSFIRRHETEMSLLTLVWLSVASSLEDLARSCFPFTVSTVELSDSFSARDLAI